MFLCVCIKILPGRAAVCIRCSKQTRWRGEKQPVKTRHRVRLYWSDSETLAQGKPDRTLEATEPLLGQTRR